MASLLRQIVAGPRARHDETGLDLCYVTDDIIAMSGPSQTYPQLAYRNPLDKLVAYLDSKHGDQWAIWEFRAEGTGYPDDAVHGRVRHYPWPDHHPPPFKLVPLILKSMGAWLAGNKGEGEGADTATATATDKKRIAVVHCKAGKGRSGTVACAYLIAERGWTVDDAVARFTARRMRPQFGSGVSIASQVRWIGYVGRWAKAGKPPYPGVGGAREGDGNGTETEAEGDTEIVEIHVWGLRHGVKLSVEGYIEDGRRIHVYHTFRSNERYVVQGDAPGGGLAGSDAAGHTGHTGHTGDAPSKSASFPGVDGTHGTDLQTMQQLGHDSTSNPSNPSNPSSSSSPSRSPSPSNGEPGGRAVLFKPETPIRVPGRDINIAIERRNKPASSFTSLKAVTKGLTLVTSVAHFWFNTYFEGNGPEQAGRPDDSGVFSIDWDQLDGIKGSTTKGTRAAERIAVVWRAVKASDKTSEPAAQGPGADAGVQAGVQAANWKGDNKEDPDADKRLGLRHEDPSSADVSRASSVQGVPADSSRSRTSLPDALPDGETPDGSV